MIVKLLTEHHLEFLSLKGGCRGSSESTLVKMPRCWKSHATAHFYFAGCAAISNHTVGLPDQTSNLPASKPTVGSSSDSFKLSTSKPTEGSSSSSDASILSSNEPKVPDELIG